jgi:hypothetical protein
VYSGVSQSASPKSQGAGRHSIEKGLERYASGKSMAVRKPKVLTLPMLRAQAQAVQEELDMMVALQYLPSSAEQVVSDIMVSAQTSGVS